jgi:hypothetical protein
MAAGLGFKTFTTGEVLTAADTNGYLMQGILVFATEAARNSAITSPQEGQFAFTKDTNTTWYYDGAAWVASGASGDVTGVTAGTGITVTDPSGPVPTVTNSMATTINAKGDLLAGTGNDAFDRLGVGANDTILTADSTQATGLKWATASAGVPANSTAFVATQETTTSTSYTGLTTSLATTLTTGTRALVIISAEIEMGATSSRGYMSYAVSGATTIAASDAFSINMKIGANQTIDAHSYAYIVTGLTAGSNTFTTQYKSGQGDLIYFTNRRISVVNMGS